jgi:toxin ParE1/3/4
VTVVQYQAAAEADLVEVWLQVADDGDINQADEYISKVQAICELIASQPDMGLNRPDIAKGVRSFPVDRYVIYYEHYGPTLSVLRVWHTAQDPKSLSVIAP